MNCKVLLATLITVVLMGASNDVRAAVFTEGHADLSVRLVGDELQLGVNLLGAVIDGNLENGFMPLSDIILFVPDTTKELRTENVPGLLNFDPIGVPAGDEVYRLPASGTEALILQSPFFGFGTYLLNAADFSSPVTFTLTGFESANGGEFSVYQDSFPGPTFYMATANGIDANDKLVMPVGAHDHYNFVFTEPGLYRLSFNVTATHKTLGLLTASGSLASGVTTTVPEVSTLLLVSVSMFTVVVGRQIFSRRRASC